MEARRLRAIALVVLAVALGGCGSTSDGDGSKNRGGAGGGGPGTPSLTAATIEGFEGMYRLDSITRNTAGCDSEGPSTLADETNLLFVMAGAPHATMGLDPCVDEAQCWEQIDAIRRGDPISGDYGTFVSRQRDESSLYDVAQSSVVANGTCTDRALYSHELHRTGDTVRGEYRTIPLRDVPGSCTNELSLGAEAEAMGRPCTELVVFSGTKTGPPPK